MNYYNEHNKHAAAWLRELIKDGQIPPGFVDERDIQEVKPEQLKKYVQCHFFAGIGGWPLALKIAGWPETEKVWTGSCPCQPFSVGGDGKGFSDVRHLWPVFAGLIRAGKPSTVFGEQVASSLGRVWLSGVLSDLEGMGFETGAADLCAASVNAPHIRQRIYWLANASGAGLQRRLCAVSDEQRATGQADARCFYSRFEVVTGTNGKRRRIEPGLVPLADGLPGRVAALRGYGNAINPILAAEFIGAFMDVKGGAL